MQSTIGTNNSTASETYMRRALVLAENGRGRVSPNPLVGCVIVAGDGQVVGEGWHAAAGGPHAEVEALATAGGAARGGTAYVTLEPCNHHGRTGPCTEALLAAGITKVVAAQEDPDPRVSGLGLARLREAGVEVEVGLLAAEAAAINESYLVSRRERRPFVLYKSAMSLDGKIAVSSGRSRWITDEAARALVHRWRDEYDAVAIGVNSVLLDDPALTTRLPGGRTPLKVVFDSVARTPTTSKLFEVGPDGAAARVLIFVTEEASSSRVEALAELGAEVIVTPASRGRPRLESALHDLYTRDITSVLLEGGGTLAWDFFERRAVDRVAWFIAPKILGGSASGPVAGTGVTSLAGAITLSDVRTEFVGPDLYLTGKVDYPESRTLETETQETETQETQTGSGS